MTGGIKGRAGRFAARAVATAAVALAALVVPGSAAAKPGDIYTVTATCPGQGNPGGVCALWEVDPDSGETRNVDNFDSGTGQPGGLAFGRDGSAVVGVPSALFGIDPASGDESLIARGGGLVRPMGIAVEPDGDLVVADLGTSGPTSGAILNVDAGSGAVKTLVAGLNQPLDVAVGAGGDIYFLDASGLSRTSPKGGVAELISIPDAGFGSPFSLAAGPDGNLYVADNGADCCPRAAPGIKIVDPEKRKLVRFLSPPSALGGGFNGIALEPTGEIVTTDALAQVFRTDPVTGQTIRLPVPEPPSPSQTAVSIDVEPPACGGETATVVGSTGRDKLRGSRGPDVIAALGGDDVIKGAGGNDLLCGGPGTDEIRGGAGRDTVSGGGRRDRLHGGAGRDRCLGGKGRDGYRACEVRRG
jgi:Ca2+-binding RTX toxin-like protein